MLYKKRMWYKTYLKQIQPHSKQKQINLLTAKYYLVSQTIAAKHLSSS